MKIRILLAGLCAVGALSTASAQTPWAADPSIPNLYTSGNYLSMRMSSAPQPGAFWMMGEIFSGHGTYNSYVVRTTNNGQTWDNPLLVTGGNTGGLNTSASGYFGRNMYALDAETAWLIDEEAALAGHFRLLKTSSGPRNFSVVAPTLPAPFDQVFFFDATTGVAVAPSAAGGSWKLYRTTDAGATWALVPNAPLVGAATDRLLNTNANFARLGSNLWFGTEKGAILHTADRGLTWSSQNSGLKLSGVTFRDAQHGLAYGFAPGSVAKQSKTDRLLRTTDGGQTWMPVTTQGPLRALTVTAIPGSAGTYLSSGYYQLQNDRDAAVSFSTDEGTTWQAIALGESIDYLQLTASSPEQIWLTADTDLTNSPFVTNQRSLRRYAGPALVMAAKQATPAALSLYPNPTSGIVRLPTPATGTETVRISDLAGRVQQTVPLTRGQQQLDLSGQAAGIYQVELTTGQGQRYTQKLVRTAP